MISTCLHYAVDIELKFPPAEWAAELEKLPKECQGECKAYLRVQWQRSRVVRSMKRGTAHGND